MSPRAADRCVICYSRRRLDFQESAFVILTSSFLSNSHALRLRLHTCLAPYVPPVTTVYRLSTVYKGYLLVL